MRRRRLAFVGARGVANYGGFETVVAELAPRLVEKGYDVFIGQRRSSGATRDSTFGGARVVEFPFRFPKSSKIGRLFEVLYDWYFVLRFSIIERCDVIYCLGIASGPILLLARLLGASVVVNLDGLEWKRAKFGGAEKAYIRLAFLASYMGSDRLILDNRRISEFLPSAAAAKAVVITYGVAVKGCPRWDPEALLAGVGRGERRFEPGRYWLVVARLEPENNIHTIVSAYGACSSTKPLLVVGSFASRAYRSSVEAMLPALPADKSVVQLGSIYDQNLLHMLRCHCFAYIHGHSVGGTNPSLLEAMSAGNIIVAHDNVFNREVCGDNALFFKDAAELTARLNVVEGNPEDFSPLAEGASNTARTRHRWEDVADAYDRLFSGLK